MKALLETLGKYDSNKSFEENRKAFIEEVAATEILKQRLEAILGDDALRVATELVEGLTKVLPDTPAPMTLIDRVKDVITKRNELQSTINDVEKALPRTINNGELPERIKVIISERNNLLSTINDVEKALPDTPAPITLVKRVKDLVNELNKIDAMCCDFGKHLEAKTYDFIYSNLCRLKLTERIIKESEQLVQGLNGTLPERIEKLKAHNNDQWVQLAKDLDIPFNPVHSLHQRIVERCNAPAPAPDLMERIEDFRAKRDLLLPIASPNIRAALEAATELCNAVVSTPAPTSEPQYIVFNSNGEIAKVLHDRPDANGYNVILNHLDEYCLACFSDTRPINKGEQMLIDQISDLKSVNSILKEIKA